MSSIWQAVTWDVARAGGFTAFGLLTLSVALGLALSLQIQSPRWPRIINNELHNFLTLLALIFTGVHVLAVWIDPFTNFGWNEVFIPFVSHYRPIWMALGIIALYLGIAIGISTWLRPRIGYALWRRLHVLTLLLYGLVVVHGIMTGSDTQTLWAMLIYGFSILLVSTLLWLRLMKPVNAKGRAHPVLAVLLVLAISVGAFLFMFGVL
ncbi:MAG TPA: ferric reductase-like transmembrane domain-containing protein [Ktedonobacteraceae bacterium]|jgi:predicted ferric reductase|nr:ferric reductase-like transmembrane domain-containing protein [Ktedonobacteraceae bacterium]